MSLKGIQINTNQITSVDDKPISGSNNLIDSNGIYKAVGEHFNITDAYIQRDGTQKTSPGSGWFCTNFIPVLPGSIIDISVATNYAVSIIAFYDKLKNFISNITTDSQEQVVMYSNTITVPSNVYYIRSCAFRQNLTKSLIIRQTDKIIENLQYQNETDDINHTKRVIKNAKMVNYQMIENQSDNWHIDVIPATFSKFQLFGSLHQDSEWQDIIFAYNEELTELSGKRSLTTVTTVDIYVPSTAKYILLTVNDNAENPAKITIIDSISPIKRSSIPYTNSLYNSFVNESGIITTLTNNRYYWHVERYNVRPYTRLLFNIPQETRTGSLAIAFYSNEPSDSTLISSYTTNNSETKILFVPETAKIMLISQYLEPITFETEDYNDECLESKQQQGTRFYKDKSLAVALRWGQNFPNFHITIDGNTQADVINNISTETPSLKSGFYLSADLIFEKINLTKNDFLVLKIQGLLYPPAQNQTVFNIYYLTGNVNIINNISCYIQPGNYTDIIHIVTDGSDYLTQCFIENIKVETLMLNSHDNKLFTEYFSKKMPFVKVTNETFSVTSNMVFYKNYRAQLLTYEVTRQKEIILNSNHIVRKPLSFNGKRACFCGDSITKGYINGQSISENNYVKAFSNAVNLTYTNKAVGGATFSQVSGLTQIGTQIKSITDGQYDFIFIAGGVNDYSRNVDFTTFRTTLNDLCDWINANLPSAKIIWITPINHAFDEGTGYLLNTYALWQYISIMTEVLIEKDTLKRYSIVKGHLFNFPVFGMNDTYINAVFGDRLHPSELGYQNVYAPGLLNALL